MNLLQLVLKQMRQRALSTWLTLISVILGSALAIGVLILRRESNNLFVQTDFGYDLIVAIKGSPMQVVLNTVYHVDTSPGNVPYTVYEVLRNNRAMVKHAVPYVVGDNYKGYRIAGTTPSLFGFDDATARPLNGYDERGRLKSDFEPAGTEDAGGDLSRKVAASTFEYRLGKKFTLVQGRVFHPMKFEAVIGADVAERTGLKLGDKFKASHDAPGAREQDVDVHDEQWEVVGVLDKTFTAEDKVLFIPLISFYAIPQHEQSLEYTHAAKSGQPLPTPATKKSEPKRDDHDDHDHKPAPATPATTSAAAPKHDHDHDHHDHDHAKPAPSTTRSAPKPAAFDLDDDGHDHKPATPAGPAARPSTTPASPKHDHDHDLDHKPATPLVAAAPATPKHDDHHDHDHDHDKPKSPATATTTSSTTRPAAPARDDHDHHDHAHEGAYDMNPDGTIHLHLSKDKWQLSAVLLRTRGGYFNMALQDGFRRGDIAMAVNPASVMREFFTTFLGPSTALLLAIALVVLFAAAVSILVSIYNAVAARSREIAIMRALGATRGKVLSLICLEAGVIGLAGGLIGLVIGHGFGAVVSGYFTRKMGTSINWVSTGWEEWVYLGGVVVLAVLAGLVPGLKAYRTPVATNLVAS